MAAMQRMSPNILKYTHNGGKTASSKYVFFMYIFQGTDATVANGFAPLGPPLLPWENRMEGDVYIYIHTQTFRLLDRIGPVVGRFC